MLTPKDLPITELDLAILRSNFTRSGYCNVYERSKDSPGAMRRYIARVRAKHQAYYLGVCQRPRDAAKLVVAWYRQHHGPQWSSAFKRRKSIGRFKVAASTRTT